MKKGTSNELHQDGLEHSKKLYRSVTDSAKRLDVAHRCTQNVSDLFIPSLQIQRSRFQEFCERLIFSEPLLFGRKAEELLWRKTYYDVISASKKLKKKDYTSEDVSNIETHINAGVGHYHHFISKLQYNFDIDLTNFVDFAIYKDNFKKVNDFPRKPEQIEWAKQSIHRCLIYLGDLCRYKLEIYPNSDPTLAIHYYQNAIHFKPEYGVPHNQMGTLASNQNHILDAVYSYMCCLACQHPFEGTENNLVRLFEKNTFVMDDISVIKQNASANCKQLEPVDHVKRLVSRFLFLTETWFFNKSVSDIYLICHQTSTDLQECLSYSKSITLTDNEDVQNELDAVETDSVSSPSVLTSDTVFKIAVICLLCIGRLQKLQANQVSTTVAFTLAVYSQLLQMVTDHIYDNLLNVELPSNEAEITIEHSKKKPKLRRHKTKLRRRRKHKTSSGDDSDVSDTEIMNDVDSNSDLSMDGSEDELVFSSSENESEDDESRHKKDSSKEIINETDTDVIDSCENNSPNNRSLSEMIEKAKNIECTVMLDIISEEKLLNSIRILSDWFISDTEIVKLCGKTTRSLLKQIMDLLNFLNINFEHVSLSSLKLNFQQIKQSKIKIALPEDAALKGTEILTSRKTNWDWDYIRNKALSVRAETAIRMVQLISFGHLLSNIVETGISYDDVKGIFLIQETNIDSNGVECGGDTSILDAENVIASIFENKNSEFNENGQLTKMKHMGQLWLAAEVRALENRVKSKSALSPYLVVDVDTLIQCTPIVKHLVSSKKFIVVVPSAVVSALDDLKRVKPEARDAIRWLELQFHHGNRFCRAQRLQERSSIPFIKYPKKKDKEMFTYIQIIECCHYFAQQQKDASNIVTLLLGNSSMLNSSDNKEVSYTGLAHSAGVTLEIATEFYEKWRKNFKGKK